MKRKAIVIVLAAVGSMAAWPGVVHAQNAQMDRLRAAEAAAAQKAQAAQQSQPRLRQAIQDLQAARHELQWADRRFKTERGDAVAKVQSAMDELFAAVGDKSWEDQDKQLRDREKREGEAAVASRDKDTPAAAATGDQSFFRMRNALDRLNSAESLLKDAGGGHDGRKAKAVAYIKDAEASINRGIEAAGGNATALPAAAQQQPELRQVIQDLQAARYELSRADRRFFTERGDAREQVQYALTQLFAAVGDKQWEQQDKDLWQQQKAEGDQAWQQRKDKVAPTPPASEHFTRMENALSRLTTAQKELEAMTNSYDGRRDKALTFVKEAEKAVNAGMEKARQADAAKTAAPK